MKMGIENDEYQSCSDALFAGLPRNSAHQCNFGANGKTDVLSGCSGSAAHTALRYNQGARQIAKHGAGSLTFP
jgi:hypothetical protein